MEEGIKYILKIVLAILIGIALLTAIYFLKNVLYEKTSMIKDVFSNLFKFS